jgi:uncharacterized repeat protein (TIGR01451 family)
MLVIFGLASHSYAAQESSFTQCANDDAAGSQNDGVFDQCEWIQGAITQINSKYAESDAVPQRFIFTHTAAAGAGDHTAVFRYDFTKSSVYTYDFVVDPNHSMPDALLNHCGNLPPFTTLEQCETALGGPSLSNMQMIPLLVDTFDDVDLREHPEGANARFIHFACANIDDPANPVAVTEAEGCTANVVSIVHKQANGLPILDCFQNCGDSIAEISIHFTHPAGDHLIEMWFAGELASAEDPDGPGDQIGWGTGFGASSAPGASFDFRLVNIDGDAAGAKTNQILNNVIEGGHDADLAIDKTCPATVVAGNDITYQIHVTNNGPHTATGVWINDTLPAGVALVSATASQSVVPCEYTVGTDDPVFCDIGFVQVGQEVLVTIVVNVPSGITGTISNTATTGGAVTEPTLVNNTDICNTTVTATTGNANLSITKSDDIDPILAGNQLTYTLDVVNAGPDTATNVLVTDSLPGTTTFVSGTWTNNSAVTSGSCSESGHLVTCSLGVILSGGTATVTIVVTVDPTVRGTITNVATVSSDVSDPTPADNSVTEDTLVIAEADLSITKTDNPDPVPAGSHLTYTVTVNNAGPSSSLNTQVLDTLPAGTSFISAIASQGTGCSFDLVNTITCDLGTILPGGSATITISVLVSSSLPVGTILDNTATTHSDETDPVPGNNTAVATTTTTTPIAVPTMNEWGMIFFMMLAGFGSVFVLRRRRT